MTFPWIGSLQGVFCNMNPFCSTRVMMKFHVNSTESKVCLKHILKICLHLHLKEFQVLLFRGVCLG